MAIFEVLLGSVNMTGMGPIASVRRRLRHVRSTSNNCRDDAVPRTAERCQNQTSARLFDDRVSAGDQRRRYGQSHCLGGLEIEHQLELRGLEEWQVARPGPLEDAANINAALVVLVDRAGTLTDQPAGVWILAPAVDRGNRVAPPSSILLLIYSGSST